MKDKHGRFCKGHKPTNGFKKGQVAWNKTEHIIKKCFICKKHFNVRPCENYRKYCSMECTGISKKGKPSWMKGKGIKTNDALRKWRENGGRPWNNNFKNCFSDETIKKMSKMRKGNKYAWKGGRINFRGYVMIFAPKHPFLNHMAGYVFEHRRIVEISINRYLLKTEKVHHVDEIKNNNSPNNLIAFTSESAHQRFHNNPNNVKPEEIIFDGRKLVKN